MSYDLVCRRYWQVRRRADMASSIVHSENDQIRVSSFRNLQDPLCRRTRLDHKSRLAPEFGFGRNQVAQALRRGFREFLRKHKVPRLWLGDDVQKRQMCLKLLCQ